MLETSNSTLCSIWDKLIQKRSTTSDIGILNPQAYVLTDGSCRSMSIEDNIIGQTGHAWMLCENITKPSLKKLQTDHAWMLCENMTKPSLKKLQTGLLGSYGF